MNFKIWEAIISGSIFSPPVSVNLYYSSLNFWFVSETPKMCFTVTLLARPFEHKPVALYVDTGVFTWIKCIVRNGNQFSGQFRNRCCAGQKSLKNSFQTLKTHQMDRKFFCVRYLKKKRQFKNTSSVWGTVRQGEWNCSHNYIGWAEYRNKGCVLRMSNI